ncbi:polymeric immunoglobulin receptor-like [Misgurnus anguillicaudatus]|uniref:polymeric immunoglobulin receptor-like n=1 Tax=Misgurnus anguillicaudatus TaxID=75329 RepID=UPI003CCF0618
MIKILKILRNETSQVFGMRTVSLKFILVILWLITVRIIIEPEAREELEARVVSDVTGIRAKLKTRVVLMATGTRAETEDRGQVREHNEFGNGHLGKGREHMELWSGRLGKGRESRELGDECRTVTVQTGGSDIIPCLYESIYTQHKKYCCYHSLGFYQSCYFLVYANETKGDVSVIDHPDQSLFTVTMRDLQEQNTGTYWCAVEIEGGLGSVGLDVMVKIYITIQSAPDLSVMSSSVTVDEGGNISVQCLYTSTYKNKDKQWCRYKDKSCYIVGRSDTFQNASVEISDDGRGSLTVVMSGLMKSDSGWYYCSVGDLQAPVQLTVTRDKNTTLSNATSIRNDSIHTPNSEEHENKY